MTAAETCDTCPESVSFKHGPATRSGRCPFCGTHLGGTNPRYRRARQLTERQVERALRRRPPSGPVDENGEPTE